MSFLLVIFAFTLLAGSIDCDNFTVTHEAWFEVEARDLDGPGKHYKDKFVIALFGKTTPITVLNFIKLTEGYKHLRETKPLHYKNTRIHRVIPDFLIQMGDVLTYDGSGGRSIFAYNFDDENFILTHRGPGWVSMANSGPDTNGSQFFILLSRARWLDKKHVVFGKVIKGLHVVRTLNEIETDSATSAPLKVTLQIVNCGVKKLAKTWIMSPSEIESTEDIERLE